MRLKVNDSQSVRWIILIFVLLQSVHESFQLSISSASSLPSPPPTLTVINNQCDFHCQCQQECQKSRAYPDAFCLTLCNSPTKSTPNYTDVSSCLHGCPSFQQFYCSKWTEKLDPLPKPHPVANSIGNSTLLLEWRSHPELKWINYTIQYRYQEDHNNDYNNNIENNETEWFNYIPSVDTYRLSNVSFIENLKPFTGYQFRLTFTPAPFCPTLKSKSSLVLRTLAAGRPPSFPPEITRIEAITPNEIFLSWRPVKFPNDQIIAYVLYLYEFATDEKRLKPIPAASTATITTTGNSYRLPFPASLAMKYQYNHSTPLHYTFTNLKPATLYTVALSSINSRGEGPLAWANITTPFFNETEGLTDLTVSPYLLVASSQSIFNYSTDLMEGSTIFTLDPAGNISITSIDIHIKRKAILIASSNGTLWMISNYSSPSKTPDSSPSISILPLPIPTAGWPSSINKIAIDWVHDIVYMLFDSSIGCFHLDHVSTSFNWCLPRLTNGTKDLHVDPVNKYLYWSISNQLGGNGLYRTSLFNLAKPFISSFSASGPTEKREIIRFLREPLTQIFTIDYSRKRIYFPHNDTIWSSSMDGTNVTNIRPNVVASQFKNVTSLVHHDDTFYWISGAELCKEEVNPENGDEIYHNSFSLEEKLLSLVLVHPTVQPVPLTYPSSEHVLIIQPSATADLKTLFWTILGSLMFFVLLLLIAKKVMRSQTSEKEALKDSERGHERNLISLTQLPDHPHEDNRLYLPGEIGIENELSSVRLISPNQFKKTAYLGRGAFGEVFEGLFTDPELVESLDAPVKVAIKTLKSGSSEQEKDDFIQEAKMMGNFRHPHILKLLGVCLDPGNNSILLELMEGGDLLSYLRSMRPTEKKICSLTLDDLLCISVDVAKGCQYLETMHFVHRDLAARNCLVSSYNREKRIVKIGDFGLARDIYKNDYYRKAGEGLLPVRWMAPESLVDAIFTTQSDVWSFGVLLWEVMTLGQQPYPARNNQEVLNYVRCGGRPERPPNCLEEMFLLMNQCWCYDPSMRPTFMACLNYLEELKLKLASGDGIITSFSNHSYYTNGASSELRFSTGGNSNFNSTMDTITTYCASSRAESIHSKYLNISVDHEGYEIPILGCSGTCNLTHSSEERCESQRVTMDRMKHDQLFTSILDAQKHNESHSRCSKSINGSPPPTYSQLFLSSSTASARTGNESPTSCRESSPENSSDAELTTDQTVSEGVDRRRSSGTGSTESLDEVSTVTTALLKPKKTDELASPSPTQLYRNLGDLMYVNDLAALLEPLPLAYQLPLPIPMTLPSPLKQVSPLMIHPTTSDCPNYDQAFSSQRLNSGTRFANLYTNWNPSSSLNSREPFRQMVTLSNVITIGDDSQSKLSPPMCSASSAPQTSTLQIISSPSDTQAPLPSPSTRSDLELETSHEKESKNLIVVNQFALDDV